MEVWAGKNNKDRLASSPIDPWHFLMLLRVSARIASAHHFAAIATSNSFLRQMGNLRGTCAAELTILDKQQSHGHQHEEQRQHTNR